MTPELIQFVKQELASTGVAEKIKAHVAVRDARWVVSLHDDGVAIFLEVDTKLHEFAQHCTCDWVLKEDDVFTEKIVLQADAAAIAMLELLDKNMVDYNGLSSAILPDRLFAMSMHVLESADLEEPFNTLLENRIFRLVSLAMNYRELRLDDNSLSIWA